MSDDFVQEVECFLSVSGLSPSALGREALGDPNFVSDVREGRRLWPETKAKVRDFMKSFREKAA